MKNARPNTAMGVMHHNWRRSSETPGTAQDPETETARQLIREQRTQKLVIVAVAVLFLVVISAICVVIATAPGL
jgi:hypothetical protein